MKKSVKTILTVIVAALVIGSASVVLRNQHAAKKAGPDAGAPHVVEVHTSTMVSASPSPSPSTKPSPAPKKHHHHK